MSTRHQSVLSVLGHQALVQIYFSWSVSFFRLGHRIWFSPPAAWTEIRLHCFMAGVMPLKGGASTHPRASEPGFFAASSDAAILQLSFPAVARATTPFPPHLSSGGPGATYTDARSHQPNQATRSPRLLPIPGGDERPTCLLAYECCRVKSKSFSRFLRCSLLQISSSPPCFPSSPPSSCLFWVLVGCSEQEQAINRKSRFFFFFLFFLERG